MKKIGDTELIINSENRIYHLNLKKEEIADKIILVGDPSRVSQISKKFQKIEFKIHLTNCCLVDTIILIYAKFESLSLISSQCGLSPS